MNIPNLLILAAVLSAEVALVVGCATLAERATKSGHWRQRIWQACFLCLGLLTLAEWFGARDLLGMRRAAEPVPVVASSPTPKVDLTPTVPIDAPLAVASPSTAPQPNAPEVTLPSSALPTKQPSPAPARAHWLIFIYPAMAALLLLALLASHLLLFRLSNSCRLVAEPELLVQIESMRAALGMSRAVRLLESDRVRGPLACGLFRPSIVLPAGFTHEFEPAQQRVVLVHELAHLANRDPAWHLLSDLMTICLWWHPAIWWARARMQSAGEAAADEASLLINNGPETLAECLVTLGTRLMREPVAGGFGIAGWRFKSNLGRRVVRLLDFKEHAWSPPGRARSFCLRALAPASLVILLLWSSAWAAPDLPQVNKIRSTRTASFAEPSANQPPKANSQPELGQVDQIEGDQTDKDLPNSQADPKLAPSAGPAKPKDSLLEEYNLQRLQVSGAEKAVQTKLKEIILPEVPFGKSSLEEAVKLLCGAAKEHDPAGEGVRIIIQDGAIDGSTGLPLPLPYRVDVEQPAVPLRTPPKQISLGEVLNILVAATDPPITYTVDAVGISLKPKLPTSSELFTKWFKVDLQRILSAIKERGVSSAEDQVPGEVNRQEHLPSVGFGGVTNKLTRAPALLRTFLREAGVDLSLPKSLYLHDRLGMLMVRATREDLEFIEQTLQVLNANPAQVTIEVRWCERRVDQPWPEGFAVQKAEGTNVTLKGILAPAQLQLFIDALQKQTGVDLLTAPKITTLSGRQAQIKAVEFRHLITFFDLAPGPLDSLHARGFSPITQPYELGPVLDIVPTVQADDLTINLTVTGTLKELMGYDNMKVAEEIRDLSLNENNPKAQVKRRPLTTTTPLPVFRTRRIASAAAVYDGQTLVLSGGMAPIEAVRMDKEPMHSDVPLGSGLLRNDQKETVKKELLLFIIPRLIDPAGNAIHSDEELLKRTGGRAPDAAAQGDL